MYSQGHAWSWVGLPKIYLSFQMPCPEEVNSGKKIMLEVYVVYFCCRCTFAMWLSCLKRHNPLAPTTRPIVVTYCIFPCRPPSHQVSWHFTALHWIELHCNTKLIHTILKHEITLHCTSSPCLGYAIGHCTRITYHFYHSQETLFVSLGIRTA